MLLRLQALFCCILIVALITSVALGIREIVRRNSEADAVDYGLVCVRLDAMPTLSPLAEQYMQDGWLSKWEAEQIERTYLRLYSEEIQGNRNQLREMIARSGKH